MVMKMNRMEFIKSLSCKTGLPLEDTKLVNKILEDNFFLSSRNKDKIISEIGIRLSLNMEEATNVYESAKNILNEEIKNKLKHPFKSKN